MKNTTNNMVLSAMFIAIGLVLPFFTGQVPQIGNMLLPMHSCIIMWTNLWLEIWYFSRLYTSFIKTYYFWYAYIISYWYCYGF